MCHTYLGMRLAELWDDDWRVSTIEEAQHIIDTRVITTPVDFARVVSQQEEKLKFGSVLLIDEMM